MNTDAGIIIGGLLAVPSFTLMAVGVGLFIVRRYL